MSERQELRQWIEDWQTADEAAPPEESIRLFVERRTRRLRLWAVIDAIIGSAFLTFLLHRTVTHPDPIEKIAMGLLGVLTAGTVAFGVWNWRGVRAANAQNTQAFVSLSIERARRLRRAIRAGWVVLTIEVAVFVPWVWYRLYGLGESPSPAEERFGWGFLAGMTALAVIFLVAMSAQASRDERRLAELREEMAADRIPQDGGGD